MKKIIIATTLTGLLTTTLSAGILDNGEYDFSNEYLGFKAKYEYEFSTIKSNLYFKAGQNGTVVYEESRFPTRDNKIDFANTYEIEIENKKLKYLPKMNIKYSGHNTKFADSSDLLKYDSFQYKLWKDEDQNDVKPTIEFDYKEIGVNFEKDMNILEVMDLENKEKSFLSLNLGATVGKKYIWNETTFENQAMTGYIDPETGELTQQFVNDEGTLHPGSATMKQYQEYYTMGYKVDLGIAETTKLEFQHEFDLFTKEESSIYDYKKFTITNNINNLLSFNASVFMKEVGVDKSMFETQGFTLGAGLKF